MFLSIYCERLESHEISSLTPIIDSCPPTAFKREYDQSVLLFWNELPHGEPSIPRLANSFRHVNAVGFYHYEELDAEIEDPVCYFIFLKKKYHEIECQNIDSWAVVNNMPSSENSHFEAYLLDIYKSLKNSLMQLQKETNFPTLEEVPKNLEEFRKINLTIDFDEEQTNFLKVLDSNEPLEKLNKKLGQDCSWEKNEFDTHKNILASLIREKHVNYGTDKFRYLGTKSLHQWPKRKIYFNIFEISCSKPNCYAIEILLSSTARTYYLSEPDLDLNPDQIIVAIYHNLSFLKFSIWDD